MPFKRPPLPADLPIALRRDVRGFDGGDGGGRVLLGGRPRRVLRLSDAGERVLEELRATGARSTAAAELGRRLVDGQFADPCIGASPTHAAAGAGVERPVVVVPVRDRAAALDACLASLGPAERVIVVDDGSIDAASVASVARRHGADLVRQATSTGPAAARNRGLRTLADSGAAAGIVAFVDSDVTLPPGWYDGLVGHFADPAVVAVAPRVVAAHVPACREKGWQRRYARARSALDLGPDPAIAGPGSLVGYVPTTCLLVRASALSALRDGQTDSFDEQLRYGEDVDLVWRLSDAGGLVRYEPRVTVAHAEPSSWKALLARRFHYGTSAGPLARRHPEKLAPAVFTPMPGLAAGLLLSRKPRAATVAAVAAGIVVRRRLRRAGLPSRAATVEAARDVAADVVSSASQLSRLATQFAGPGLAVLALARPSSRRTIATLLTAAPLVQWVRCRPPLDPVRWTLASVADDAAYGSGVVVGARRSGTLRPLLPRVVSVQWRVTER